MIRKTTKRIVVHHSASPQATTTLAQIRQWHKAKGFTDPYGHSGYHYFIDGAGKVFIDRPDNEWGCGVKNANQDAVHVCVAGNFNEENPTDKQLEALEKLLTILVWKFNLKYWNIYGHRDIKWLFVFNTTQTACPGNNLYAKLKELRQGVFRALQEQK